MKKKQVCFILQRRTKMKSLIELIEVISPTAINTYAQCPYKYYCRYVLELKKPPTPNLAFGISFDHTANESYKYALEKEELPPKNEVADIFVASWEEESKEIEDWWDEKPGAMKDEGVALAKTWVEQVAIPIQPIAIQPKFQLEWDNIPWRVMGIIDLVFQRPGEKIYRIGDTKTSKRKWSLKKLLDNLQLPAYAVGASALYGQTVIIVEVHVGIRKKTPETQVLERTISQRERQEFIRKAAFYRAAIAHSYRTGIWLPQGRDSGHPFCSRRYCPYWAECEKEWGGNVAI